MTLDEARGMVGLKVGPEDETEVVEEPLVLPGQLGLFEDEE